MHDTRISPQQNTRAASDNPRVTCSRWRCTSKAASRYKGVTDHAAKSTVEAYLGTGNQFKSHHIAKLGASTQQQRKTIRDTLRHKMAAWVLIVVGCGGACCAFAQSIPPTEDDTQILQTIVISAYRLPEDPFAACNPVNVQESDYDMCVAIQIANLWDLLPEPIFQLPNSNYSSDSQCQDARNRVNTDDVQGDEGFSETPYLPTVNPGSPDSFQAPNGNWYSATSGLTIGNGVDLQWWTAPELISWGVDPTVVNYFSKYNIIAPAIGERGMYGQGAYQFLQTPVAPGGYASYVTITNADVQAMDTGAMAAEIATAATVVDNLTSSNDFFYLPSGTQTAITDLVYSGNFPAGGVLQNDIAALNWSQFAADAKSSANQRVQNDGNMVSNDISDDQLPPQGGCGP